MAQILKSHYHPVGGVESAHAAVAFTFPEGQGSLSLDVLLESVKFCKSKNILFYLFFFNIIYFETACNSNDNSFRLYWFTEHSGNHWSTAPCHRTCPTRLQLKLSRINWHLYHCQLIWQKHTHDSNNAFIPDSEAQRRWHLCRSRGFLYSYIYVYQKTWATREPPGQYGVEFQSDTMKNMQNCYIR